MSTTSAATSGLWIQPTQSPSDREGVDVLPLLVATDGAIAAFGQDHRR